MIANAYAIERFRNYSNIPKMKQLISGCKFSFKCVAFETVKELTQKLGNLFPFLK